MTSALWPAECVKNLYSICIGVWVVSLCVSVCPFQKPIKMIGVCYGHLCSYLFSLFSVFVSFRFCFLFFFFLTISHGLGPRWGFFFFCLVVSSANYEILMNFHGKRKSSISAILKVGKGSINRGVEEAKTESTYVI